MSNSVFTDAGQTYTVYTQLASAGLPVAVEDKKDRCARRGTMQPVGKPM